MKHQIRQSGPAFALAIAMLTAFLPHALASDSTNPTTHKSASFKANSRLVLVDLVVTDDKGQPVHGLQRQDFTITEDGKPQRIVGFQEQTPDARQTAEARALNLPKNVYTNFVSRTDTGALTVLLLDSLNTDRQHLAYAKREMLSFLKSLPPGKRIALFTLGGQLRMVQGFTDNTDTLIAAAQQLSISPHTPYSDARERSASLAELSEAIPDPNVYRAVANFLYGEHQAHLESRSQVTLDALSELAHSLAGVPGRKNLIWVCAGLPFDITSNAPQLHRVAALLADTQIAVYPVDVRGVVTMSAEGGSRDSEVFAPVQTESYESSSGLDAENVGIQEMMLNMAKLTGGRAYFNTNDLHSAIASGMETGSNYYTLAYRPENSEWNGKFRKITAKTSRPNLKVLNRSGYYALLDPLSSGDDPNRVVSLAMQPNVPLSTQLIMKARVAPPEEAGKATSIDMLIDVQDISFRLRADSQKTPEVQFVAVAWDAKGQQIASFSEDYNTALSPPQLERLMRTGLQLRRDMMLKTGSYRIRLGVMDRLSGRIGTLDVPVVIEAKVAAK